ncbi:Glutathione peroxidase [hydrothermal vent metagenome]|uniref:Glutathione peroxidase n=1 Tax=hydrothermal vent metagenome TaxID=652676 RepID=A0A3B0RYN3_9ZZZZ
MKILAIGGLLLVGAAIAAGAAWLTYGTGKKVTAKGSAHDFSFQSIDGEALPLKSFEGKALLLVNTASQCGFTPQYEGLETLYETYGKDGLVVLGAPSNDFGGQEPGTEAEIKEFCQVNFNIKFPMTAKVSTKGEDVHPFYAWIRAETGDGPKWNFHKYLIAPDGTLVGSFPSAVKPMSSEMTKAVQQVLP